MGTNISADESKIGIKKATTWGTEVSTAGGLFLFGSDMSPSGGFADIETRDVGLGGYPQKLSRGVGSFPVSAGGDATYNQSWLALLGAVMGTEAAPVETTVGQGDYAHTFDLASRNRGFFYTAAYLTETDKVQVLPSVKFGSFTISSNVNDIGTWQATGIGDRMLPTGATNTAAIVSAITASEYSSIILGAPNSYLRFGPYSTTTALTSASNMRVLSFSLSIARNLEADVGLRGALSPYTEEPIETGSVKVTIKFQLSRLDSSQADIMSDWYNSNVKMVELFCDGAQIGTTGVNRSFKIQIPSCVHVGSMPAGYAINGKGGKLQPTFEASCYLPVAAAAGMTGVTTPLRIVSIDKRTTAWSA